MSISIKCVHCSAVLSDEARFCTKCGTQVSKNVENHCTNSECIRHKREYNFKTSDSYCDMCGKLTFLGEKSAKYV